MALSPETIAAGFEALTAVRGRLEAVPAARPLTVLIDYAHKTDALEHCLGTVAQPDQRPGPADRRLRLRRKPRPPSGPTWPGVAERLADRVIVTSDNRGQRAAAGHCRRDRPRFLLDGEV